MYTRYNLVLIWTLGGGPVVSSLEPFEAFQDTLGDRQDCLVPPSSMVVGYDGGYCCDAL